MMGIASRIVPSSASFNPNDDLIVGIRDAQLANPKPEVKKKMLRNMRCLFLSSMNEMCANIRQKNGFY